MGDLIAKHTTRPFIKFEYTQTVPKHITISENELNNYNAFNSISFRAGLRRSQHHVYTLWRHYQVPVQMHEVSNPVTVEAQPLD